MHPLVEIAGVKLTIAICYDVHFLAEEAADVLAAADLLVFPSAWVEEEGDTRTPMFLSIAGIGVSVALAYLFINVLRIGPMGSAYASSIAWVVAVICWRLIFCPFSSIRSMP